MTVFLSMFVFALVSSITPGPVNLVALNAGAQYGFAASLRHVTGATVGFVILLVLAGLGLQQLVERWPVLIRLIQWGGVAFLFFMSYQLLTDDGQFRGDTARRQPSLWYGAMLQWLNPKAWLASLAGMSAYAADGTGLQIGRFAMLYFLVCYGSIACWAYAGTFLRQYLQDAARVRFGNRVMAALLTVSAVYLLWH